MFKMMSSKVTKPVGLVFLTFVVYVAGITGSLIRYRYDPMHFVHVGTIYAYDESTGTTGYDGQFFYYIAQNPIDGGDRFDSAAQRYQRILYPVVAWLLSFGSDALLPWVLIVINLVSATATAFILSQLSFCSTKNVLYLLPMIFWAGQTFSVAFDLSESLCFALLLLALYLYERKKIGWSAVVCGLAVLTKEVAMPFAAGFVVVLLFQRNYRQAVWFAILSVVPYGCWQIILKLWFGRFGFETPGARFEFVPFAGLSHAGPIEQVLIVLFIILPCSWAIIEALREMFRNRRASLYSMFVLFNAPLMIFLPGPSYVGFRTASRVLFGSVLATFLLGTRLKSEWMQKVMLVLWLPVDIVYFFVFFA